MKTLSTEVLIVGGGLSGVAAAWALASAGHRVTLTEESDWLGGQLTSQGVPPDEHPWIERFGSTQRYRDLRTLIRHWYRSQRPLGRASARQPYLNPGAGLVSPICHEPAVAAEVIASVLEPFVRDGSLTVLTETQPIGAETTNDEIRAVSFQQRGEELVIEPRLVIEATETGDLLALAGVEHVIGFESRNDTGEALAPDEPQPSNVQAASWCFAVEHHEGEDHTIDRPADYARWRDTRPSFWPGPQFGWTVPHPHTREPRHHTFTPNPPDSPHLMIADQSADSGADELWTFRRILARNHFTAGTVNSDITLVNWPMIDYLDGPVIGGGSVADNQHRAAARSMSLSFLYWLQTDAPRPDGGTGYPGLRPHGGVMGTSDGFAKRIYHRESRRIVAQYRVTANDLAVANRSTGAAEYDDSIGVGAYRIDLHPSTGGDNYIDIPAHPFQIPMGALLPVRIKNLLAAGKNIGTTHITNGCYRLHPVEWAIGEAAGVIAGQCLDRRAVPTQLRQDTDELASLRRRLELEGVETAWPRVRPW